MSLAGVLVTVLAVAAVAPSVGVAVLPPASLAVVGRCPAHCPAHSSPVCGTDNRDYDSVCRLLQAACLQADNEKGSDVLYLTKYNTSLELQLNKRNRPPSKPVVVVTRRK